MDSDNNGFLIASRRLSADDSMSALRGIQRDTSAILQVLSGRARSSVLQRARSSGARAGQSAAPGSPLDPRVGSPLPSPFGRHEPRQRDARGRFVGGSEHAGAPVEQAVRQLTRQQAQQAAAERRANEARRNRGEVPGGAGGQPRDARGRFGSGDEAAGAGEDGKGGLLSRLKEAISDKSGSVELDDVDPAIAAATELRNLVGTPLAGIAEVGKAVMGRGFAGGGAKRDEAVPWYRRMLVQLRLLRKDEREFNQAELRAINGQRSGGSGGDDGLIMQVLKMIFSPVGVAIVAALAGVWAAVGDKIGKAWDVVLGKFLALWEPIAGFLKDKFNIVANATGAVGSWAKDKAAEVQKGVSSAGNAANGWIKDKTGVDVKQGVASVTAPISRLIEASGLKRVYGRRDGAIEQRDGGSVSWRNNNPGNLKFEYAGSADKSVKTKRSKERALQAAQRLYGPEVIDLDQWGNAIFSSPEAGRGAQAKLLRQQHGSRTVDEMLPKYAVSDYSGKANPKAYADNIYKLGAAKGVNLRGKKIGDLSDAELNALLDSMKKVEGHREGATTVTGVAGSMAQVAAIAPASAPAVSAPRLPPAPMIALPSAPPPPPPAPRVEVPIALNSAAPTVVTLANDQLANQDVRDRRLAQIVTGGLSGA